MDHTGKHVRKFWKGYVAGTNRGQVIIRMKQRDNNLRVKALLKDEAFGASIFTLLGNIRDNRGDLRILESWTPGLVRPLDGKMTLEFGADQISAEGRWETDIGTTGLCKIYAVSFFKLRWWFLLFKAKALFLLRKAFPAIYTSALIIVAGLDLSRIVQISYPTLFLLLVPSPYVYRLHLKELIQAYRVKRIGPVELEQEALKENIKPEMASINPALAAFILLNHFFVSRTKLILLWLSQKQTVTYGDFVEYAKKIGIPDENIEITRQAIIYAGCASVDEDKVTITDFGKQYVAYINRLTSGASA